MINTQNKKSHRSFWFIISLLLIWNLLGCINFFAQLNADIVMQMPESHQAIINSRSWWVTSAFAINVFGGTIGCLLLLLKKYLAQYFLFASLIGVFVQLIPNLSLVGLVIVNPIDILMVILLPPVVAIFLVAYTRVSLKKSWID